jgi:hypothetical protein
LAVSIIFRILVGGPYIKKKPHIWHTLRYPSVYGALHGVHRAMNAYISPIMVGEIPPELQM